MIFFSSKNCKCKSLQITVVLRSKCKKSYDGFILGYELILRLCLLLSISSPSAVKHEPELLLDPLYFYYAEGVWAQQSAYGKLWCNVWDQESALMLQLCPVIRQCDRKGKTVPKFLCIFVFFIVLQVHRLYWCKFVYSQNLLSRERKPVSCSLGEGKGRATNSSAIDKDDLFLQLLQYLCYSVAGVSISWDEEEEEG